MHVTWDNSSFESGFSHVLKNPLWMNARAAVLGNCATIVTFRVSGEDAETLNTEFATNRPAHLLQDLSLKSV
jgi:hypothetical protein